MARLSPILWALLLSACWTEQAADVPYDIAPSCTLDRVEAGWSIDGSLVSPRREDPVGATYPAFALLESRRSIEDVQERARRVGEVLLGRTIPAEEIALAAKSSTGREWVFSSPALLATYEPDRDELWVDARLEFPVVGPDIPAITSNDAFLRFRCAHDRLRLAGLLEEATYPPEHALLSVFRGATMDTSSDKAEVWIEAFIFTARRYVEDVIAPGWVEVTIHPSGALQRISVSAPKLLEISSVVRESTWEELEQRLRTEADALAPGKAVTIESAPLLYERVELPGGANLGPVQSFHFWIDGLVTRGGFLWSYRIDDPGAPKRDHAQDP